MNKTEYLLVCLAEECSEVSHAVAKSLRFGLDDGHRGITNREQLRLELADVLAIANLLNDELGNIYTSEAKRVKTLNYWGNYESNIR
jgi:NTP pyrophosphatase (non-canonical NTP hydrolase)